MTGKELLTSYCDKLIHFGRLCGENEVFWAAAVYGTGMSVTPAPQDDFRQPHLGAAIPILAAALVLVFVAFTSWFWLAQNQSLLPLIPLYAAAAFFCIDMVFLARRLLARSKDIY